MPLCKVEVLRDAEIGVFVSGAVESANGTIAKRSCRGRGHGGWIQEGDTEGGGVKGHRDMRRYPFDTVRASREPASTGRIAACKNCLRKARVEHKAGAYAPTANGIIQCVANTAGISPAMSEGQFVDHVSVEQRSDILRTLAVVAPLIIRILRERPAGDGLRFCGNVIAKLAEEPRRVAQAFGPGVVDLRLQAVGKALLQD